MRLALPLPLIEAVKKAKMKTDLDQTKFVRAAIRKELDRLGIEHDLTHAGHAHRQPVTA